MAHFLVVFDGRFPREGPAAAAHRRSWPLGSVAREGAGDVAPPSDPRNPKVQLYAVDHSARASMKSAASCVN